MERTSIRLGGVEIASSVMNASGARSAERGELFELGAVHGGALVFKSCNVVGLEAPENLKNRGVEYFAAIARELSARGKKIIGSVVGASEEEFIAVAKTLDRAGAAIVELNLADDYVANSLAPFSSFERAPEIAARAHPRRDRMRSGSEGSAAGAIRAARDRRLVQVNTNCDRGMRQ